jgi:hypothetical protein
MLALSNSALRVAKMTGGQDTRFTPATWRRIRPDTAAGGVSSGGWDGGGRSSDASTAFLSIAGDGGAGGASDVRIAGDGGQAGLVSRMVVAGGGGGTGVVAGVGNHDDLSVQGVAQVTRRLLPRLGVRKLLLAGFTLTGLGQVWLYTISNTGFYQLHVLGGIVITAFGMGLGFLTASVAVTSGVGPGERGLAGGLFVTAQQVGQAIGLAALATIAAARTNADHGSLVSGYKASFLVAIGLAVAARRLRGFPSRGSAISLSPGSTPFGSVRRR